MLSSLILPRISMHMSTRSGVSGLALWKYLTNRFSGQKGGGKQVPWGKIQAHNKWYINEDFLLRGMTFCNPNQVSEVIVKAYWSHWYDLAQAGQQFCFKSIKDYQEPKGNGDPDEGGEMEVDKPSGGEESGDEQQEGTDKTPKHCKSEEEKIAFLHALLSQSESRYQFAQVGNLSDEIASHLLVHLNVLSITLWLFKSSTNQWPKISARNLLYLASMRPHQKGGWCSLTLGTTWWLKMKDKLTCMSKWRTHLSCDPSDQLDFGSFHFSALHHCGPANNHSGGFSIHFSTILFAHIELRIPPPFTTQRILLNSKQEGV